MKLGYIRVSTKEQNIDRQIQELCKYGIEERSVFIDHTSGKDFNRPQYEALKNYCRKGDELYIHELDRLGRSKKLIFEELNFFKEAGVIVRILDIPTTLTNFTVHNEMSKTIMDMINNLLLEVLSTLAEQELLKLHKRQREGIDAAKEKGIQFGRPKKYDFINKEEYDKFSYTYNLWKNNHITAVEAFTSLGVCKTTFYARVKQYEAINKKNKPTD